MYDQLYFFCVQISLYLSFNPVFESCNLQQRLYSLQEIREHSFLRKGGGPEESRGWSLNFYMVKKGDHPIFHNVERWGSGNNCSLAQIVTIWWNNASAYQYLFQGGESYSV